MVDKLCPVRLKVQLIVFECDKEGSSIAGPRIVDATFRGTRSSETIANALRLGNTLRCMGKAVIVRPLFNEGYRFREWRSFNGLAFQECNW